MEQGLLKQDHFDKVHEGLQGLPGFVSKQSTVVVNSGFLQPASTWVIESIKTDEHAAMFIQCIDASGSVRLVLPQPVVERIKSQSDAITKARYKIRGQRASQTRLAKSVEPGNEEKE